MNKRKPLERIRDAVDVRKLLEVYGAQRIHGSGNIRSTCPIHRGDNPTAFAFNEHTKLYYCHTQCQDGGDVFDFVMKIEDCSFLEAAKKLAEMFNISVDWENEEIDEDYFREEARKFIEQMRKRNKQTKLPPFKFKAKMAKIKEYRGFSPEAIEHWKLRVCLEGELANRVVMPIEDIDKRLVGVTGRRLKNDMPNKWMHRPRNLHTGWVLTGLGRNLEEVRAKNEVIVVEGIFDCVRVWDCGLKHVCTPIGTFFTEEHEQELYKAGVTQLVIGLDNDPAGRNGTRKMIERLKYKFDITVLNLPEGKDPCDCTCEELLEVYNTRLLVHEWYEKYGKEKERL
ncbi:toprim domain-containing protein [Geobacillus kaustophilus NBRC 102445]|uniref:CHC2 zinc finger domain-containing protein n=1 Tax=Geobacillus kaustophilus TaxID=1462 RepID=UPI0010BE6DB3|nr:CHC2 zinc finger domain-containing protein [Geobacillus kaustophilus]QCK84079.1 toprim domain-containing protein [Geobacillus kaustophilus NBRC 102445]